MSAAANLASHYGSDLTETDYQNLEARWITRELADSAGLRRVDAFTGRDLMGQKRGDYSGISIPYFTPEADRVREYRIRRDNPEFEQQSDGTLKPKGKYAQPVGTRNMLYLPPGVSRELLASTTTPVVITEGEFKTLSLWRLANHELGDAADAPRFIPIGLGGVWNWFGTVGKALGPKGDRVPVKGSIIDLDWLTWTGRRVIIAFDADAATKSSVAAARAKLRSELHRRGAEVGFLEWDIATGKGIDDHLATVGPGAVLRELASVSYGKLRDRLITNQDGNPRAILANAITLLRESPEWAGVLGFNEFSLNTVALAPPPWHGSHCGDWTDHEDRMTADWLQRAGVFVCVEVAGQAVQCVAQERTFHPVREYLNSLKWDGVPRIENWLTTYLGADRSNYTAAVGSRWLISAVARVKKPGAKADCSLILEGPQGGRKSTALSTIAGPYFTDEIADLGGKDASMQTRGVWIIEIAELDSMSRPEISKIKAFMSRPTDRFRPPYGKRLIESPRQCVFAGSVNHSTYLRDETGGRRFWPVHCSTIDIESLARDRDQLWAEAVIRFDAGASWWLDTPELNRDAAQEQADRYESDPWDAVIAAWIEAEDSVSIEQLLTTCLDKPKSVWSQSDHNRVARSLRSFGWERYKSRSGAVREWRYRRVSAPVVPV